MAYNKKEIAKLLNAEIKKPSSCTEIKILIKGAISKPTLFRYLKKLLKSGDLLYVTGREYHPRNFPTKLYLPNNLKSAKKRNFTKTINK